MFYRFGALHSRIMSDVDLGTNHLVMRCPGAQIGFSGLNGMENRRTDALIMQLELQNMWNDSHRVLPSCNQ